MDEWLRGLLRELLSAVDQEDGCPSRQLTVGVKVSRVVS